MELTVEDLRLLTARQGDKLTAYTGRNNEDCIRVRPNATPVQDEDRNFSTVNHLTTSKMIARQAHWEC